MLPSPELSCPKRVDEEAGDGLDVLETNSTGPGDT